MKLEGVFVETVIIILKRNSHDVHVAIPMCVMQPAQTNTGWNLKLQEYDTSYGEKYQNAG